MSLHGIFDPMVRAYFKKKYADGDSGGGGADEMIVKMARNEHFALKSDAVTEVLERAFSQESRIASVDLPNAISVLTKAFAGCGNLTTVTLEKANTIGEGAFDSCPKLDSVNLPSVQSIGIDAFNSNDMLSNVSAPKVATIGKCAFRFCTALKNINLPSVQGIGESAFLRAGLEKADFAVLESIGKEAFSGCANLTAIIIRTTSTVCVADITAFNGTPMIQGTGHIYVPASMYEMYRAGYEPSLDTGMFDILFRKIEDYPEICG